MLFLYDIGIQLYYFFVLLASVKSEKAAAWIKGRKNLLRQIESQTNRGSGHVWFHFASLGEFEQGRPVLEEIKETYPDSPIVVTFFSPSGYEVRKEYRIADHVFYLPLDTRSNAKEFIALLKPSIAVFTKYEYWYYFFDELQKNGIPLYIISGIFRDDQPFFKWYGGLHRKMLRMVSYFFVQNEHSKQLLNSLKLSNVSIAGDTRFDRVVKNVSKITPIHPVESFCGHSKVFIVGSSWPSDEVIIATLVEQFHDWKFIIAPHEIHENHLSSIQNLFPNSIRFSELSRNEMRSKVLIIDNIGMLSSLYQYGHIAYIGGGFGAGIHNTLEAAAFGMPVIFGPNYAKFQEAIDLIENGSSFSIKNAEELADRMRYLQDDEGRTRLGKTAQEYVASKAGATEIILHYLRDRVFINS